MDLKKLFMNNKAVSPVIGVILMVAITVILAAAIGSSVFGQGTAQSAPQANIDIKTVNLTTPGFIKIEHLGGDAINFNEGVTKVTASYNGGDSTTVTATSLGVMDVGSSKVLKTGLLSSNATSGDTLSIKIIDIKTNQLICDKDLRF